MTQLHPKTLRREGRKQQLREKGQLCPQRVLPLCEGAPQNPAMVGLEGTSEVIQTQPLPWAGCSHWARLFRVHPAWPGAPPGVGWVPLGCLPINFYSRCLENVLEGSNIVLLGNESVLQLSGAVGGTN